MKISILLTILIALLLSACTNESEIIPSGKVIKIGVLAPMSGKYKTLGQQSLQGLKAAQKMRRYLKNGDEIVFEVVDTKNDTKNSKKAFLKFLKSDVTSVFSFMNRDATLAMKYEFQKHKIPIISTLSTANEITLNNDYISQVCMDDNMQVLVASHYIRDEKLIQNVGVVYSEHSKYSSALAYAFKEYFVKLGGNIDFFIDIDSSDGLQKFHNLNKKSLKMLFNTTDAILSVKVLRIINEQGLTLEVLGAKGLFSNALEVSKDSFRLFEGVYVVEHYAHETSKSRNRKRLEQLLDKDGLKESSYAFLSYDAYQLLLYALDSCSDYNPECVNSILKNSDVIEGISKNFSMVDAKAKREVYIDKIVKSKLQKEVVVY